MSIESKTDTVTFRDITEAFTRIKCNGIKYTECSLSEKLSNEFKIKIYLKHEFRQSTGSYKERGVLNFLLKLNQNQREKGVIAASAGNHALALSYHGNKLSIPVTVCVPETAPIIKIQRCKEYGAKVIIHGKDFDETKDFAIKFAHDNHLTYVNGFDDPLIIAGQGTVMMEIAEQVENFDAIVVPVGGGGLIAGIATAAKHINPKCTIVGVEPVLCASMHKSILQNQPTTIETPSHLSIADGLCVKKVGDNTFCILSTLYDEMVQVEEYQIFSAILKLIEYEKFIVEGAAAVGIAALMAGKLDHLKDKRIVIILSGSNIDTCVLARTIDRALYIDGRIAQVSVIIDNQPSELAKLHQFLAENKIFVRSIDTKRVSLISSVHQSMVTLLLEFQTKEHMINSKNMLKQHYGAQLQ